MDFGDYCELPRDYAVRVIADATGRDVEDVAERLNAALKGEGEPAETLGFSLGNAAMRIRVTGWDDLTDWGRHLIRFALIADHAFQLRRAG